MTSQENAQSRKKKVNYDLSDILARKSRVEPISPEEQERRITAVFDVRVSSTGPIWFQLEARSAPILIIKNLRTFRNQRYGKGNTNNFMDWLKVLTHA